MESEGEISSSAGTREAYADDLLRVQHPASAWAFKNEDTVLDLEALMPLIRNLFCLSCSLFRL